jgi:hypothetical protein
MEDAFVKHFAITCTRSVIHKKRGIVLYVGGRSAAVGLL